MCALRSGGERSLLKGRIFQGIETRKPYSYHSIQFVKILYKKKTADLGYI